jgi:hypothetical protein
MRGGGELGRADGDIAPGAYHDIMMLRQGERAIQLKAARGRGHGSPDDKTVKTVEELSWKEGNRCGKLLIVQQP